MKAAITIDLDTLNDYAFTYGLEHNHSPDPVYKKAVPRILLILKKHEIRATFFVIGRDLNIPEHLKIIKLIKSEGHEIANHSFNHHHNFDRLPKSIQRKEIINCHEIVKNKLKFEMVGFRAPGYNISKYALRVLGNINYLYDSSIFPTSLLPVLKLAMVFVSRGNFKSTGGGKMSSIFSTPFSYFLDKPRITEVPITVTPILRLPFVGTFNIVTGRHLFLFSLRLLEKFSRDINYEFHAIELLDFDNDNAPSILKRHPGAQLSLKKKIDFYNLVISEIKKNYQILPLIDIARWYKT